MEDKKIDWGKYTKAELIEVLKYIEPGLQRLMPWLIHDITSQIERRRLEAMQAECKQLMQETHEIRMEAIRLQNTGSTSMRTLQKIDKLWKAAMDKDRKMAAIEKKIDALVGI